MKKRPTPPDLDTPAFQALRQRIHGDRAVFERLVYGCLAALGRHMELMVKASYQAHLDLGDEARIGHLFKDEATLEADVRVYFAAVRSLPPWTDLLGFLHAEVASRRDLKGKGQHFTPNPLATASLLFMPRQTGGEVSDPTCGSGALLLAAVRQNTDLTRMTLHANDRDPLCCAMTALQLLASSIMHADTQGVVGCVEVTCADVIKDYLVERPVFWRCERMTEEEQKQLKALITIGQFLADPQRGKQRKEGGA